MDHDAPALVLFAHGARDPRWAEPFLRIAAAVRARRPHVTVELAFLELMPPPLEETVTRLATAGHRRVTVAPLFMAQGGHLREDLPKLIETVRQRHPEVELRVLPAVGDVDAILDAIADWLVGAVPH